MNLPDVRILLHDIRSVHNAGAIFRTADAIGAGRIYLSGYTPAPLDRFGRPRADFAKCALGAEKSVPWERVADESEEDRTVAVLALVERLKRERFTVIAVEQNPKSVDYKSLFDESDSSGRRSRAPEKALVIFGNEVEGVDARILAAADVIAEIPMRGGKESLNVSVSAGIVLFRWFDR